MCSGGSSTSAPVKKDNTTTTTTTTTAPEPEAIQNQSIAANKTQRTGLAGRDTKTTARGLKDNAVSKKKELLGG